MKKWLFLLVAVSFCMPTLAQKKKSGGDPFSGSYIGKGFRPGESYDAKPSYQLEVQIEKVGDYYQVRWFERGQQSYYGLGIHVDNVLSVSYLSMDNSIYGTVSYRDFKAEKGYIVGAWCIAQAKPDELGNGQNGMEVLWPK